jgi:alkylation response protein AidB-like acyl-CoA dehydrogenase
MVLSELQRALPEPVARVSVDRATMRFLRAAWRLIHAAQVIGAAERCVELFQQHGKTRKQFGVPIAGFQAVQQQAAAHFANLAAASALTSFAEWCAVNDRDQVEEAALSAWHAAARMGRPLAEAMVQIHGGIGFTWEYDLHLYLRRIVALELLYPLTVDEEWQLLGGKEGGGDNGD